MLWIATVISDGLQVVALMASVLGLRSALVGFIVLMRGGTAREIADDMAFATASGVPAAGMVGIAAALYLVFVQT